MFIVNREGRVVDLPHRMEESGFAQAREVLSISQALMDGVPVGHTMTSGEALRLRDDIRRKFPSVVVDEEYMESSGWNLALNPAPKVKSKKKLVSDSNTKSEIVEIATLNGVKLSTQDKRLVKAKLMQLVNERHAG